MVAARAVALAILLAAATAAADGGYRVIVSDANPTRSVSRSFLAQVFLRKVQTWGSGDVIHPVDLDRRSPTRSRFTEDALGRSVAAVRSYWQQMIFSGRNVPPPELPSDDAVVNFVVHDPGAIGYVSEGTDLKGARAVPVE